jgi:ABC-2 type transport system permease protein
VIALARAELLKLRSTRTALGLFIAVLVIVLLPLIGLLVFLSPDDLAGGGLGAVASLLVPLVLLVFGILGMTGEYRHRTITYAYLVAPRRWQVMAVKLSVYALVGILTMLATVVMVYLVTRLGGAFRGMDIDAAGGSTMGDYAREIAVSGLITAFGVALGALLRAQVVTVAGALIWALVVENIVLAFKPAVGAWLPFTAFQQVSTAQIAVSSGDATASSDLLTRPQAFVVSIVYIAVVSVAAVFISLRRDVT